MNQDAPAPETKQPPPLKRAPPKPDQGSRIRTRPHLLAMRSPSRQDTATKTPKLPRDTRTHPSLTRRLTLRPRQLRPKSQTVQPMDRQPNTKRTRTRQTPPTRAINDDTHRLVTLGATPSPPPASPPQVHRAISPRRFFHTGWGGAGCCCGGVWLVFCLLVGCFDPWMR